MSRSYKHYPLLGSGRKSCKYEKRHSQGRERTALRNCIAQEEWDKVDTPHFTEYDEKGWDWKELTWYERYQGKTNDWCTCEEGRRFSYCRIHDKYDGDYEKFWRKEVVGK